MRRTRHFAAIASRITAVPSVLSYSTAAAASSMPLHIVAATFRLQTHRHTATSSRYNISAYWNACFDEFSPPAFASPPPFRLFPMICHSSLAPVTFYVCVYVMFCILFAIAQNAMAFKRACHVPKKPTNERRQTIIIVENWTRLTIWHSIIAFSKMRKETRSRTPTTKNTIKNRHWNMNDRQNDGRIFAHSWTFDYLQFIKCFRGINEVSIKISMQSCGWCSAPNYNCSVASASSPIDREWKQWPFRDLKRASCGWFIVSFAAVLRRPLIDTFWLIIKNYKFHHLC